jgi:hypothetical protein
MVRDAAHKAAILDKPSARLLTKLIGIRFSRRSAMAIACPAEICNGDAHENNAL